MNTISEITIKKWKLALGAAFVFLAGFFFGKVFC